MGTKWEALAGCSGGPADRAVRTSMSCRLLFHISTRAGTLLRTAHYGMAHSTLHSVSAIGQPIAAPLKVWLGGVQAPVSFQGRGCCYGEEQIVFTVPNTVPSGCAVPLVVQIGDEISNSTVMPVATSNRDCTPVNPALAAAGVEQAAMAGTLSYSTIKLRHKLITGSSFADDVKFQFEKILAFNRERSRSLCPGSTTCRLAPASFTRILRGTASLFRSATATLLALTADTFSMWKARTEAYR